MKKFFLVLLLLIVLIGFSGCVLDKIGTGETDDPLTWAGGSNAGTSPGNNNPTPGNSNPGDSGQQPNNNPPSENQNANNDNNPPAENNNNPPTDNGQNNISPEDNDEMVKACEKITKDNPNLAPYRKMLEEQLAKPVLCKATLLSIASFAQLTCLNDVAEKAIGRLKPEIEKDLANPPSCQRYILDSMRTADALPEGEALAAQALVESKKNLERVLTTPGLCQKDYLEAATLAQSLGFGKIADNSISKVIQMNNEAIDAILNQGKHASDVKCESIGAIEDCGRVIFDQRIESKGSKSSLQANFIGYAIDKTFYSYIETETKRYLFEGEINWSYYEESNQGCFTVKKIGSGKQKTSGYTGGYLEIQGDGSYSGSFSSFDANVKVSEFKAEMSDPSAAESCKNAVPQESYYETVPISFAFEGKSSLEDRTHGDTLVDQINRPETFGEGEEKQTMVTITNWKLEIPPC